MQQSNIPPQEALDPYLGKKEDPASLQRKAQHGAYKVFGGCVLGMTAIFAAGYAALILTSPGEPTYAPLSGVPLYAEVQPLGDSYNSELGLQLIVDGEKSVCTGWGETKDVTKAKVLLEDRIDSGSNVDMSIFYRDGDCRIKQLNFLGEQISLYWQTGD